MLRWFQYRIYFKIVKSTLWIVKGDFDHVFWTVFLIHSHFKTHWAAMAPQNMSMQCPLCYIAPSTDPT